MAAEIVKAGGVVIVPTETVYGVACHPNFPEALERIRKMKGRDRDKPFQLLASSVEAVWTDGAARSPAAVRRIVAVHEREPEWGASGEGRPRGRGGLGRGGRPGVGWRPGAVGRGLASTVASLDADGAVTILRQGSVRL